MRVDPYEAAIMRQCRDGIQYENEYSRSTTGSFCRKFDLCRESGRCHFVAQAEYAAEHVAVRALPEPISLDKARAQRQKAKLQMRNMFEEF